MISRSHNCYHQSCVLEVICIFSHLVLQFWLFLWSPILVLDSLGFWILDFGFMLSDLRFHVFYFFLLPVVVVSRWSVGRSKMNDGSDGRWRMGWTKKMGDGMKATLGVLSQYRWIR